MKTQDCKSFYEGEVMRSRYVAAKGKKGEEGMWGRRTHPAVHPESWIPAVCLPQTRGNLEHKRDRLNIRNTDRALKLEPVPLETFRVSTRGGSPKGQTIITITTQRETQDKP